MPDTYHNIQFRTPHTMSGVADVEPTFGTNLQMVVTVKNPLGDPAPTAPIFHASMSLADTVELDPLVDGQDTESDYDRGIRTTLFYYDYNPDWTIAIDRQSDAATPWPALPTNVYNFEYKDKRDAAQGYTSRAYFTTA